MIRQSKKGLNSRSLANPYNKKNYLPLITAPMYSVINKDNIINYESLGIQICLPRDIKYNKSKTYFQLMGINDFINLIEEYENAKFLFGKRKICIDTANGNLPILHDAIVKAKSIFKDDITIIAGNVSSSEAFLELAKTGVDYIRVGIGGGGSCNTTLNTGVGQEDLEGLVYSCYNILNNYNNQQTSIVDELNTKIIADGISSYVNQLVDDKQGYDNGYAAINRLLYAGADLVMIGKLFAQSLESSGTKYINTYNIDGYKVNISNENMYNLQEVVDDIDFTYYESVEDYWLDNRCFTLLVDYYGMSTQKAQRIYKNSTLRHSEGNSKLIPVKWTLNEWINGSTHDSDYLPGFINVLKSAMSYTGSKTLNEFKIKK